MRLLQRLLVTAILPLSACGGLQQAVEAGMQQGLMGRPQSTPQAQAAPPAQAEPTGDAAAAPAGGQASIPPQAQGMYASMIFGLAFGMGGLYVEEVAFQPGDFVRWNLPADSSGRVAGTIERARLHDDDQNPPAADGKRNQWWRVKMVNADGQTVTLEALLTGDLTRLLRLRGQFPGETAGHEVPVTEGATYHAPARLTTQSLQGALKGVVEVAVPAGKFKAKHVVYAGTEGSAEWWLADTVPGGVVRQAGRNRQSGETGVMELAAFGKGAVSELGSK